MKHDSADVGFQRDLPNIAPPSQVATQAHSETVRNARTRQPTGSSSWVLGSLRKDLSIILLGNLWTDSWSYLDHTNGYLTVNIQRQQIQHSPGQWLNWLEHRPVHQRFPVQFPSGRTPRLWVQFLPTALRGAINRYCSLSFLFSLSLSLFIYIYIISSGKDEKNIFDSLYL